jgi:outer membrane immunogenic protein
LAAVLHRHATGRLAVTKEKPMRMLRTSSALALTFGLSCAPAFAADAIAYTTSAPDAAAMPVADGKFDWNGFYAGVYGVTQFSPGRGAQYGAGLDLGLNAQYDFYLLGAEVAAHGLNSSDDSSGTSYGQVLARGGVLVTDDVAVYAAAGYGLDLGPADNSQWLLGGGLEMAVTDNVSLRAQYLHGFANTGEETTNQVTIGANYHF